MHSCNIAGSYLVKVKGGNWHPTVSIARRDFLVGQGCACIECELHVSLQDMSVRVLL